MSLQLNSTLAAASLPTITLVGDGPDQVVDLATSGPALAGLVEVLRHRFAPGDRVGILYGTEPRLLLTWLAALYAGLEPLILQYPNAKQNFGGWRKSVLYAVERAALAGVICSPELEAFGLDGCKPFFLSQIQADGRVTGLVARPQAALLQMSSGTTGQRKPLRLTLEQVAAHVGDYNQTMGFASDDRIVSWLPLYHDMGFVACFLMPLMLGVPIVMMDPMTWVRRPSSLFEAIRKHNATTCYMPNFGFEVMAKHADGQSFPSMRRWVSCSEVVQATTFERFASATKTPRDRLCACYAMAENVFAVTQRDGMKVITIDGNSLVSCGPPIRNVSLKIVDGEIWVRSPSSLVAYLDGAPITDADGFYPTGDLGRLIDGELVIIGRKHELVNIGGKKYLLHDLDRGLVAAAPNAEGRAAALARREASIGTEVPLFLIEGRDFYLRSDREAVRARLARETELESFSLDFVPPGFLTKTTSGKFNRRTSVASYEAALAWRETHRSNSISPSLEDEIVRLFGELPFDVPIETLLDSLGLASLTNLLSDADLKPDPALSLKAHLELLRTPERGAVSKRLSAGEHIAIVSLADGRTTQGLTDEDLKKLGEAAGVPVTFEQVCLPPIPVTLSDLVFFDYFLPSAYGEAYRAVAPELSKVRSASLLLVDDVSELLFGQFAYPALNHRLERSAAADLLIWRWQPYTRYHDKLPISTVNLWQTHALRNEFIHRLSRYLSVPIFRIATLHSFSEITAQWDYVSRTNADWTMTLEVDTPALVARLASYLKSHRSDIPRRSGPVEFRPKSSDIHHFCSMFIDQAKVDEVLDAFDRFCLVGIASAAPYIRKRLKQLGKPFVETSHRNLLAQGYADKDFDCVLQVGSWGRVETTKPVFQIFSAGWDPLLQPTAVGGRQITEAGWFHANPATAPNELSGRKSILWLLGETRTS